MGAGTVVTPGEVSQRLASLWRLWCILCPSSCLTPAPLLMPGYTPSTNICNPERSIRRIGKPALVSAWTHSSWEAGPRAESDLRSPCNKAGRLSQAGLEVEEWEESREKLTGLSECLIRLLTAVYRIIPVLK